MTPGVVHVCSQCGRHAFAQPTVCYWCARPLSDETRAVAIAEGVTRAMVAPDAWEQARRAMRPLGKR